MEKYIKFWAIVFCVIGFLSSCEKVAPPAHYQKQELVKYKVQPEELKKITYQQMVYVSVYSEIFSYNEKITMPLAATLSIRNTDLKKAIYVSKIDYYDSEGKLLKKYIDQPTKLTALQTHNYLVDYDEEKGGAGANFIIEWGCEDSVNQPIFECIMISTANNLGISFVTEGKIIQEHKKDEVKSNKE
jgi:hypothetical protein